MYCWQCCPSGWPNEWGFSDICNQNHGKPGKIGCNRSCQDCKKEKLDIRAILAPDELKGYVLVEAPKSGIVELAIQTIPHARALVKGSSTIAEIEHFLKPKPIVTGIKEGAIIEVTSGPFKGRKPGLKGLMKGMRKLLWNCSMRWFRSP